MVNKRTTDTKCIEHCWITMKDGVRLSARLWLPETADIESVPGILEYIPYRKRDMVRLRDECNHPYFAQHGYACVRVDMRGSGDSEGTKADMYDADELDDAIQVIEWIARQPWCNGKLGMMGTSWGGTASFQAASRQPEALKAIIAVCATTNRFDDDIHHMGGCLLTDTIEWGATFPAILAAPPDPISVGDRWREIWQCRLDELDFPLSNWICHESRDDYWKTGALNENPKAITCPILAIGGWSDRYSNTVMNVLNDCHQNCWGIVGPWGHHYPDQGNPGPAISFQLEALRWWDYWLKGMDNGVVQAPKLRVWLQEFSPPENKKDLRPGQWISESSWPSENMHSKQFGFSAYTLTQDKQSDAKKLSVPWNLQVGLAAGDTGYFGRDGGLPLDQQSDDDLSLYFDSAPLTEAIEILGKANLILQAKADQPIASLAIRINDVSPKGDVSRVTYAIRNLALDENGQPHKHPWQENALDYEIEFPNTAYKFAVGHRIRISISSTYWPLIWPSPKPVSITLNQEHMTLCLPVRLSGIQTTTTFDSPEQVHLAPSNYSAIASPSLRRSIYYNDASNRQSVDWHQPKKSNHLTDINLGFSFETWANHSIDFSNPNSAKSRFEHRLQFEREGWSVEVIGIAELTSTVTHYRISGSIDVYENNELTFSKKWMPDIHRTCS